ncbi:MAG: dihydrolipoyl dehydrogenase [Nitrososphaeraceae archaeon]
MQKFDLIVIGSGSGLDVATSAAQHGLAVAVVEKDRMGGTCLNRGCIPSKLLIHSADIIETIKQAAKFGIVISGYTVEFQKIIQRVNDFTDHESDEIRNAFEGVKNPKLFSKECKFIRPKTIKLIDNPNDNDNEQNILAGEKILIAAGTRPRIPSIAGLEETDYITSDQALRLKYQPATLTIIGGGYVACEMAHFFGALGTKINIIQIEDVLLPNEDEDISQNFTQFFSKKYNVFLGYETEYVSKINDNGSKKFYVQAKKKSESLELVSDQLLIAAGRMPNSDTLNLDKTGVEVDDKGNIKTDMYLETNINGIFALGDVVGRYLFKHSANHEAKYAYNNIIHHDNKIPVDYTAMPHAIFTSPQVAGVGFTEQKLKNQNQMQYVKSIYPYINTAMGKAVDDQDGFVKFLVDKGSRKILGCHIIGEQASILIHEVLVAMMSDDNHSGTIDSIARTIHVHPALSEVVVRAAAEF